MIMYLVLCFHLDSIVNSVNCKMMKGSYCISKYLMLQLLQLLF